MDLDLHRNGIVAFPNLFVPCLLENRCSNLKSFHIQQLMLYYPENVQGFLHLKIELHYWLQGIFLSPRRSLISSHYPDSLVGADHY